MHAQFFHLLFSLVTGKLKGAIEKTLDSMGLQRVERIMGKVIQLHETMIVRHGVMLVGTTATGKTTCAEVLSRSLTALAVEHSKDSAYYRTVEKFLLNPKSISMGELYGEINPNTKEWTDGLVYFV